MNRLPQLSWSNRY